MSMSTPRRLGELPLIEQHRRAAETTAHNLRVCIAQDCEDLSYPALHRVWLAVIAERNAAAQVTAHRNIGDAIIDGIEEGLHGKKS